METPPRYICPILMELMQEPFMCRHCSNNFEGKAIFDKLFAATRSASCPTCRANVTTADFSLNRAFREEIQQWLKGEKSKSEPALRVGSQECLISASNPHCVIFMGKFGVGKSKTINSIVGRSVCETSASAKGVTQMPKVAFNDVINGLPVMLVDAPGLCDPDKSNIDTFIQVTSLIQQQVVGFDVIFHIIKMGRLDEAEIAMPELLLNGLSSSEVNKAESRSQLAKRYKIIITHCDSSPDDDTKTVAQNIIEFRAVLKHRFPPELQSAVENAIFVEHNDRLKSDYNNVVEFRSKVLAEIKRSRELMSTCYKPQLLSNVIAEMHEGMQDLLHRCLGESRLRTLNSDTLLPLQSFFKFVKDSGHWQAPRDSDNLPGAFLKHWNELPVLGRDDVAAAISTKAVQLLEKAVKDAFEKEAYMRFRSFAEDQRPQQPQTVSTASVKRPQQHVYTKSERKSSSWKCSVM